jgi:hypothetical protein
VTRFFKVKGASCALMVALAAVSMPQAHGSGVSSQGAWETTLQARDLDGNFGDGPEAFFDTVLNVTWLADANYARTSGYDDDGLMTWAAAQNWVAQLNLNGITGWRLPVMLDTGVPGCESIGYEVGTDCGYNVNTSTSEMAHLFHVTLGNMSDNDALGNYHPEYSGFRNQGPFIFAQGYPHWAGVEYAPHSVDAWYFDFLSGFQMSRYKLEEWSAWAVHTGDVGVAMAVPEPEAYVLGLAGLAALLAARKCRVWPSFATSRLPGS